MDLQGTRSERTLATTCHGSEMTFLLFFPHVWSYRSFSQGPVFLPCRSSGCFGCDLLGMRTNKWHHRGLFPFSEIVIGPFSIARCSTSSTRSIASILQQLNCGRGSGVERMKRLYIIGGCMNTMIQTRQTYFQSSEGRCKAKGHRPRRPYLHDSLHVKNPAVRFAEGRSGKQ